MNISTDPALLDVELPLPQTLIESPSMSTFLPDEEAAICPLLSNNNISAPLTLSHPLTPITPDDGTTSANLSNTDCNYKAETSSESSNGIGLGIDNGDSSSANLFNKHNYHHLQNNNNANQENNTHCLNGGLSHSKQAPSFVSWNWPLIRKCTFFLFMSALLAMCAIVVAMILTLPKSCNPKTDWYRGGVFYEIFPASFQDSNNDGVGDLRGIVHRIDYIADLGFNTVRLNSIFPSAHYPDDYESITSINDVAPVLGKFNDVRYLADALHRRNMSLLLDLPVGRNELSAISSAIDLWLSLGVDGFYVKGLENVANNGELPIYLQQFKTQLGTNRVLLINESLLEGKNLEERAGILMHVDLVDFHLNVFNGTKQLAARIEQIMSRELPTCEDSTWIHWSLGGVDRKRLARGVDSARYSLAATIMQIMLPGTPNIFYGDEIAIEGGGGVGVGSVGADESHGETKHLQHLSTMRWSNATHQFTNRETLPWLPSAGTGAHNFDNIKTIAEMNALRARSPSIYKNAICKPLSNASNTKVRSSNDDILIIERTYPRRNSFASVTNLGTKRVTLDMTAKFYSGTRMLIASENEKIYFNKFEIGPLETIVVKLDK